MAESPTSPPASEPTASDRPQQAEWLSYREAAERLGIDAAAVAARARRGRWPKRRRNDPPNAAEVLVPAELLAAGPQVAPERDPPPPAALTLTELGAAVRQIVAPLQETLDREVAERQALQAEAGALRDRLATANLDTASVRGELQTERVKREGVEATATDLRQRLATVTAQLDRLQADAKAKAEAPPRRRPWWKF
jgi:hypothetical protein